MTPDSKAPMFEIGKLSSGLFYAQREADPRFMVVAPTTIEVVGMAVTILAA